MKPDILRAPSLSRALKLAAITVVITLQALYAVFMETDYGKPLFFTYDEVWDSAKRHEAAGDMREAERLIRHIVVMEENRVTLKYGVFVWYAGPDYLVRAKLKLANLDARRSRLKEADRDYRDAIASVVEVAGIDSWLYPMAQLRYAEFLLDSGQAEAARQHLATAQESADAIARKTYLPWQEYEGSHQPVAAELSEEIAALRRQHGWSGASR